MKNLSFAFAVICCFSQIAFADTTINTAVSVTPSNYQSVLEGAVTLTSNGQLNFSGTFGSDTSPTKITNPFILSGGTLNGSTTTSQTYLSGSITGNGTVTVSGSSRIYFYGSGYSDSDPSSTGSFTGTLKQTQGFLAFMTPESSFKYGTLTLNGSGLLLQTGNYYLGALEGTNSSAIARVGAGLSEGTATLIVGREDNSVSTFAGKIQLYSNTQTNIEKVGTNTWVLTGSNDYTGTTKVTGGTLQIGNNTTTGTLGTGAVTVGANGTLVFARSNDYSCAASVTTVAGASLIKNGAGTVSLTNPANLFAGTIAVNAGTLALTGTTAGSEFSLAGAGTLTLTTGNFSLTNNTSAFTGTINVQENARLTKIETDLANTAIHVAVGGAAKFDVNTTANLYIAGDGNTENIGSVNGRSGAIRMNSGAILSGSIALEGNSMIGAIGKEIQSTIALGDYQLNFGECVGSANTCVNYANYGTTLSGAISGSATSKLRIAGGTTIKLTGNNSGFLGNLNVVGATVETSQSGIGGATEISLGADGKLKLTSAVSSTAKLTLGASATAVKPALITGALTLTGDSNAIIGVGYLKLASGSSLTLPNATNTLFTGSIDLTNATLNALGGLYSSNLVIGGTSNITTTASGAGSNFVLKGALTGSGTLQKSGYNHLELQGQNQMTSGTIAIAADRFIIVAGSNAANENVVWNVGAANLVVQALSSNGTDMYKFGDLTGNGTVRNRNSNEKITLEVGALGNDSSYSGQIYETDTDSVLSLIKTGSGTWTLTNNNLSYKGSTTVELGTLELSGTANLSHSDVTVENGAFLSGTGTIAENLLLETGGNLVVDFANLVAGTSLSAHSVVFEEGATINFLGDYVAQDSYTLLSASSLTGLENVTLDFSQAVNVPESAWSLAFNDGKIIMSADKGVPEPSTYILLLLGLISLAVFRKRSK